jgi:hypothetical protein
MRLELTRDCSHKILSLARLPIPTLPRDVDIISLIQSFVNWFFSCCPNFFAGIFFYGSFLYFFRYRFSSTCASTAPHSSPGINADARPGTPNSPFKRYMNGM